MAQQLWDTWRRFFKPIALQRGLAKKDPHTPFHSSPSTCAQTRIVEDPLHSLYPLAKQEAGKGLQCTWYQYSLQTSEDTKAATNESEDTRTREEERGCVESQLLEKSHPHQDQWRHNEPRQLKELQEWLDSCSSFSFVADEDLCGWNVLLLTSLLQEVLKYLERNVSVFSALFPMQYSRLLSCWLSSSADRPNARWNCSNHCFQHGHSSGVLDLKKGRKAANKC